MLCPRCGSETPKWSSRCENCGLALIETKSTVDRHGPYRPGHVVAERYEIGERIATDPLYWTYAAFDQEEERPVSIRAIRRTILPRTRDHEEFTERFEPLRALEVPGVARTLRVERDEGQTLVIAELVDGLSLKALIDLRRQESRAFSAIETLAVISAITEALEAAAKTSAHGDLRPPHVMILDDELLLEAFGLAPALPVEETLRALKVAPDASGYLAPEVLEGAGADRRADVYSLAVIAGELLTGRLPPAQSALEEFLRHLPPLTEVALRRRLIRDHAARDESALELVSELTAVLGAETWKANKKDAQREVPKDPSLPAEPSDSGTIPMISPFELSSSFPRDPALPASPAPDGTIPVAFMPPPTDLGAQHLEPPRDDADATLRTSASAVEHAVAALEAEELVRDMGLPRPRPLWLSIDRTLPKDPWVEASPSTSGTQQITTDMLLGPVDEELRTSPRAKAPAPLEEPAFDKDPRVEASPSTSGTQQITADMLIEEEPQPFEEEPLERLPGRRSYGLDPRLVRAARRLDLERIEDVLPTTELARVPSLGATADPGAGDEGSDEQGGQAEIADGEPPTGEGAAEEELSTVVQRSTPAEAPRPTPAYEEPASAPLDDALDAPFDAGEIPPFLPEVEGVEEIQRSKSPPPARSPRPTPFQAAAPRSLPRRPDEPLPPAALTRGSLGPLQEKVSGGERPCAAPESQSPVQLPEEPGALPAVVVDEALTEAFGPVEPPAEPTYKVRAEALRAAAAAASAPPAEPEEPSSWWFWMLVAAMLGGTLLLVFVVGLWLLTS